MMLTWIKGLVGLSLVGLSACGPLQQGNENLTAIQGAVSNIAGAAGGGDSVATADGASAETGAGQPAVLTRAIIEAQEIPVLRMSLISSELTGLVYLVGANGSKITWLSPDGVSFVYDDGLLVGTRGLGDDLMGSDVTGAKRSVRSGGNHTRTLDYLNGLSQIERRNYQCASVRTGRETITIVERSYTTTIIEETCASGERSFKNTYWRGDNGVIWQSRQWISDGIGYLGYQRL